MSLDALTAALQVASQRLLPGQAHYPTLFEDDGITPKRASPAWLVDPIKLAVENTEELQPLLQKRMHTLHSIGRVSAWHLADASIHRLFAGIDPSEIVTDLLDLAQTTTCTNLTYVGLYGGGVSDRLELAYDVFVVPAELSPPSRARELIFGIDRWGRPAFEYGIPQFRPNIALVLSEEVEIFPQQEGVDTTKLHSIEEKIERSLRALTLSSQQPFARSWQMSWLDHPAISYEGLGGWGASGPWGAPVAPRHHVNPVEPRLAQQLYSKLASLPTSIKSPVELAIGRLQRSRTHASSADVALDLGIASEIILLHGNDKNELKFRLSLRGAYLLGEIGQHRRNVFARFQKLYDARSQAVHRGILKPNLAKLLGEFDELCVMVVRKIVNDQRFPDWDELTLGATASDLEIHPAIERESETEPTPVAEAEE